MNRIKDLRNKKGESQSDLANAIGVSLRTIQNYEAGSVDVPYKNLEKIAQHYDVTSAYVFGGVYEELDAHGLMNDYDIKDPLEIFKTKAGSLYEELPNGKFKITVPLVPIKAEASYISHFSDADYVSDLTHVTFIVDQVGQGSYRAFEIKNDSMNDGTIENAIPQGAYVLGRELGRHHWKDKIRFNKHPYWIIIHQDSIICKQIIGHDVEKGIITCHSINESPEYSDFEINLNEVHQLYNILKRQI